MYDLDVLVPSRNEMFLKRTVEDVLSHIEGNTGIIVVADGAWPDPPLEDHPRVRMIYHSVSIGQRAATNEAARLSEAKWVMKLDAHCAVGQGFDRIMMEDIKDDWTLAPTMYNLHAFDWVCQSCGFRKYQGPTPKACDKCGGEFQREMIWQPKRSPETTAMRFDKDLKFQYWSQYKRRQKGDCVETMSILGACWMVSRERYIRYDFCDEGHGSWGQQGTEVALKSWLSGGCLMVTRRTWFAHMFRTQGGDFGFPYPLSGRDVERARAYSRTLWLENGWSKATREFSWILDHFAPIPDWHETV